MQLRILTHYAYGSMCIEAEIGMQDTGSLYDFVDASSGVYHNVRIHAGGATTFGIGVLAANSKTQKLSTTISTEAEIVATSECMPKVIFIHIFLEAQSYPLKENMIFQDKQSAIRMEVNGKKPCRKRARKINVQYFYVEDLIEKDLVRVK